MKKINQLKRGEFFVFAGHSKVYQYSGKDRYHGFHYVPVSDIWGGGYYTKNGNRLVNTNIQY